MTYNKRRDAIWAYNSYFGAASLMQSRMNSLLREPLATKQTKEIAGSIAILCEKLAKSLKTRSDQ